MHGGLWSLSIEEQFYLVFPFVVYVLGSVKPKRFLIGAIAFAPAFRIVTAIIWPDNERIQYLATPARVDALAIGALRLVFARAGGLCDRRGGSHRSRSS